MMHSPLPQPIWSVPKGKPSKTALWLVLSIFLLGGWIPTMGQLTDGDVMVSCASLIGGPDEFVVARFSPQGYETMPQAQDLAYPGYHGPTDNWTRGNLGEIFGLSVAPDGNTYCAASAIYYPFDFDNARPGGGVHKIDASGATSLLAALPNMLASDGYDEFGTVSDQEPGLGNLCFDQFHDQLLVTNFDDGNIYQVDPTMGTFGTPYDPSNPPMAADNPANGWSPLGDRVWGIASFGTGPNDVEVFYSVWATDFRDPAPTTGPNSIRSVQLDAAGNFLPGTDQLAFNLPNFIGETVSNPVADIAISSDGLRMLCAERPMWGDISFAAHEARLLEYTRSSLSDPWVASPITKYEVGNGLHHANSAGGVDFGLWDTDYSDDDPGQCDTAIWVMAAPLVLDPNGFDIYGLQQTGTSGGAFTDGVWSDLDGLSNLDKGVLGDVEVMKSCLSYCELMKVYVGGASLKGKCCFDFTLENNYSDQVFYGIRINFPPGSNSSFNPPLLPWMVASFTNSYVELSYDDPNGIPTGTFQNLFDFCFDAPFSPFTVTFEWLDDVGEVLCTDTTEIFCTPDPDCVVILNDSLFCEDGQVKYSFFVQNLSGFTAQSMDFHLPAGSNIDISPDPFQFATGIPAGATAGPFMVVLDGTGLVAGDTFCWFPSIHDGPTPETSPNCCSDSTLYCLEIPECDPCELLDFYADGDPYSCTYRLYAVNDFDDMTITSIETELINGGTYTGVSPSPNWQASFGPLPPTVVTWETDPAGFIGLGTSGIGEVSLSYSPNPNTMVVRWFSGDSIVCTDTLTFVCDSSCVAVIDDSVLCENGQVQYNFTLYNNSNFQVDLLTFVPVPPSTGTVSPNPITVNPGIPIGDSKNFTVQINGASPGSSFCYYIIAHDHPDANGNHTNCCPTDTICITIPDCVPPCPPSIDVIGDTVLCRGEQTVLCGMPCGNCSKSIAMEWTLPDSSTSNSFCVVATSPGLYCVDIWCNGAFQGTVCQTIYPSGPTSGVTIQGAPETKDCANNPVTLTADICCADPTFLWSNGATTPSITVYTQLGSNSYSVIATCNGLNFTAGVSWTGINCDFRKQSTGAQAGEAMLFEAFPNPFSTHIDFKFQSPVDDEISLLVYAADGRLVQEMFSGSVRAGEAYTRTLNANGLSEGIYYLRLQTQSGAVTTKKVVLLGKR